MSVENKKAPQGGARHGAFWNMMGSGVMAANTVLLTMLAGHYTSLEEVGMFTLALTTAQILYSVGLFGVNDLQMTDYAHCCAFTHYFWAKLACTGLAVVLFAGSVLLLGFQGKELLYAELLTAFMLVNSFAELYQSLYFQNRRLDLSGKSLFYRYLLSTIAFSLCMIFTRSLVLSSAVMLAVDLGMTAWWIVRYASDFRDSGYGLQPGATGRLLLRAFPLGISLLTSLLLLNAPKYLIHLFVSDEVQGAYTILFMPVYAVNLMSQFLFKPFLYRYSTLLNGEEKGFAGFFAGHLAVIGVITISGAVFFRIVGVQFLKILFGQDLSGYRSLMSLFMLSGGVMALNQLLYYLVVILREQKAVLVNYVTSAILTLLTGFLAVPHAAIRGAWACFTVGQLSLLAGYGFILFCCMRNKRKERAA